MQTLSDLLRCATEESFDLRGLSLENEEVFEETVGTIDLKDCSFSHCTFSDCRFDRTGFQNVRFVGCDLSGSSFSDCGFKQVYFEDCRLFGTVFDRCLLNTGHFSRCSAKYIRLSGSSLRSFPLEESNFSGGSLARLQCKNTSVKKCDFTRCDFSESQLSGFDFTDSLIDGATWSLDGLKNVTVTTLQALELARLLGLNIEP